MKLTDANKLALLLPALNPDVSHTGRIVVGDVDVENPEIAAFWDQVQRVLPYGLLYANGQGFVLMQTFRDEAMFQHYRKEVDEQLRYTLVAEFRPETTDPTLVESSFVIGQRSGLQEGVCSAQEQLRAGVGLLRGLQSQRKGGRELSTAITQLQTGLLWLREVNTTED